MSLASNLRPLAPLVPLLLLALAPEARAQTIDFETLPNGTPTTDRQEISDQFAVPPFGVTFRVIDRNTGQFIAFPKIAKVGGPRTAFAGCSNQNDRPLANAGVCESFLTDDAMLGSLGSLEVTYVQPVVRATAALLDVDDHNATQSEQWTVTAFDAAGNMVDVDVVDPPPVAPCGGQNGNGTATPWSVTSPTGAAEIVRILIEFTGNAPINNIGVAFDNFTPAEAGIGTPVTACVPNPNSSGLPAVLFASGSPVLADNQLRLRAQGLPANASGYFLNSLMTGLVMNPAGSQGNLCLAGSIGRLNRPGEVQNGGPCGIFDLVIDLTVLPSPTGLVSAMVGDTWSFQCWYRDANPGPESNFSDAVSVTLQ